MSRISKNNAWLLELGLTDYDDGLALQEQCEQARKDGDIPDLLILLEHNPVYTMGRGADPDNLLLDRAELEKHGIKLREVRRGGDITFHGPGQVVGYPILDLSEHKKDAHYYLRTLEQVLIETLKEYGLEAMAIQGLTGVWCEGKKIAAIGVGISRWVTTHGFALNVNTDLSYFSGIVSCGLQGKQITSMQALLQRAISMEEVRNVLSRKFAGHFNLEFSKVDLDAVLTSNTYAD